MTIELADAEREVGHVRRALHEQYAHLYPVPEIDRVVDSVAQHYLANPVLDFVGVLVDRAARAELRATAPVAASELTSA
jgi:hypothetical protein